MPRPPRENSWTWQRRGTRFLVAGYFVALILIVAATLPALVTTLHTLNRQQAVFDRASSATSDLLVGALNEETGLRGYLITTQQSFLQPYGLGTGEYDAASVQLRQVDLGATFEHEMDAVSVAFGKWRALAEQAISDVEHHRTPIALAVPFEASVRQRFEAFRSTQARLAGTVQFDAQANRNSLHNQIMFPLVVLALTVLLAVVIGMTTWLWWRVWGQRPAVRELELANRAVLIQAAIDASSDGLFVKDLDGRHLVANRAWARAVSGGNPDAEMVGHTIDDFLSPQIAAAIQQNENEVIRTGAERQFGEVLPMTDGPHVFSITKSPLRDTGGSLRGIFGVARDVTREFELLADRERLYELEHRLAETLQRTMLRTDRVEDPRLDVCARYLPASDELAVGGDWYDVLPDTGGRLALMVGDVVGHGIDAATVMGQLRSALAALIGMGVAPGATLEVLDRFAAHVPGAYAATCIYATLDPERRELRYSSAGHMPPMVVPAGRPVKVLDERQDPPLAVFPGRHRRTTTVTLEPGSLVVLYTDGLIERRTEALDVGLERLTRWIEALRNLPVNQLCDRLIDELIDRHHQDDDAAMIVARLVDTPNH